MKLNLTRALGLLEIETIGEDLDILTRKQAPYEMHRGDPGQRHTVPMGVGAHGLVKAAATSYLDYKSYRDQHEGQEPSSFDETASAAKKRNFRYDYAIEQGALVSAETLPHTGLSYMVRTGGLCEALYHAFGLERLRGIRQLGFLQLPCPMTSSLFTPASSLTDTHNRFRHSSDVMAVGSVICANVGITGPALNIARSAFFSHDTFTPAGSDSVKLVDRPGLNEDANYGRRLRYVSGWPEVRDTYGMDDQTLIRTIHNKGVLGQILDFADKVAYTARDVSETLPLLKLMRTQEDLFTLDELFRLLECYPYMCGIWDAVEIWDDKMVVTDAERLWVFLMIRAHMFREIYYHPSARFPEELVSRVLVKKLYNEKTVTRNQLLAMTDRDLCRVLDDQYRSGRRSVARNLVEELIEEGDADRMTLPSPEEAEAFARDQRTHGNPFVLITRGPRKFDPGIRFLVPTKNGPRPFEVAYPSEAREIEHAARMFEGDVHAYFFRKEPCIPRATLAAILESLETSAYS